MKRILSRLVISTAAAAVLISADLALAEEVRVDPALTPYQKVSGVDGNLNSIGSDTLNNLMTFWVAGFRKIYPDANFQIQGKGSATAPPALIEGTAQIGPMSRPMTEREIKKFEASYGFEPTRISVAFDSLAVYVNRDNLLEKLSLKQVDAIFSKSRKRANSMDLVTWGQLGLKGPLAGEPITIYGRNSDSGTYGFFKEHVMGEGEFKDTVKEQPGSASVVLAVTEDKAGIGYSGIGYKTSGVKAIALSEEDGAPAYGPTYENVLEGKYPLGRMLYLYIAKAPDKPLPRLMEEFLKYVLSKEGQQIVIEDGYLPLPAEIAEEQRSTFLKKQLEDFRNPRSEE